VFDRLLQVIEKAGTEILPEGTVWALGLHRDKAWVAFQFDPHRPVGGKEGAHLLGGMGRFRPASEREARMDAPWFSHA
jgi:hypothetical protein